MSSAPARIACALLFNFPIVPSMLSAAEPGPVPKITDAVGETPALKSAKITFGTRRLAWTADKAEALEFRETTSTTFADGILTLVPMAAVESLSYDSEKKVVALKVAGIEEPLLGSTQYQGINQIGLDAEVDKGTMGVAAVKYRGGLAKTGIKAVTFPAAKPWAAPKAGKPFAVTANDPKAKPAPQAVADLQPLYRFADGTERLVPTLYFEKTLRVPFGEIKGWKQEPIEKGKAVQYSVTVGSEKPQTLVPIKAVEIDGKEATLLGLAGVSPVGIKLYPLHTVAELKAE